MSLELSLSGMAKESELKTCGRKNENHLSMKLINAKTYRKIPLVPAGTR